METIEAQFEDIVKRDWFINFGRSSSDAFAVDVVQITKGAAFLVPRTYTARLRIYNYGASFTVDGNGAVSTTSTARYDATVQWPSEQMNTMLRFDEAGFLGGITTIP